MFQIKIPSLPGDDYRVHQHLKSLFPGDWKILFQRADDGIHILTEQKPQEAINEPCREIHASDFEIGSMHSFTIRLNPARRDNKLRKRIPIEAEQTKPWIRQQFENAGVEARFQYIREGIRRSRKNDSTISLNAVLCFGTLTIKDLSRFRDAFQNGIGHAKGLGFGMFNIE